MGTAMGDNNSQEIGITGETTLKFEAIDPEVEAYCYLLNIDGEVYGFLYLQILQAQMNSFQD